MQKRKNKNWKKLRVARCRGYGDRGGRCNEEDAQEENTEEEDAEEEDAEEENVKMQKKSTK